MRNVAENKPLQPKFLDVSICRLPFTIIMLRWFPDVLRY